jgi:hypothetical protein
MEYPFVLSPIDASDDSTKLAAWRVNVRPAVSHSSNGQGGPDIRLAKQRWEDHIRLGRGWLDDRILPLIRETITDPDEEYESDRSSQEGEIWRRFDDIKDGTPDYLKVIIRYDTLMLNATSGKVVTAYIKSRIDSKGTQRWKRP